MHGIGFALTLVWLGACGVPVPQSRRGGQHLINCLSRGIDLDFMIDFSHRSPYGQNSRAAGTNNFFNRLRAITSDLVELLKTENPAGRYL
jgi:hypothetical protein